jgi:hypothetical protein
MTFSLTQALIDGSPTQYEAATQTPFLRAAAEGRLPKHLLARWLANDRLYIHSYIKGVGRLLTFLDLPVAVFTTALDSPGGLDAAAETRILDWMIESLVNVRREETFFLGVTSKYGLQIDLETEKGQIAESAKLDGLHRFEALFGAIAPATGGDDAAVLPWLEGAVVFWGTEKCYLDAWSWAKSQQNGNDSKEAGKEDLDGGALRVEFIPNWTSEVFASFVDRLGGIIDDAVVAAVEVYGGNVEEELLRRAESRWHELLLAEASFWPQLE